MGFRVPRNSTEEIQLQASKQRTELERMGFTIIDADICKSEDGHDFTVHHAIDYSRSIKYNISWSLQADTDTVTRITDLRHELTDLRQQFSSLNRKMLELDDRDRATTKSITELKCILRDNPGVAEQFQEIITMLKLAGWDNRFFS